MKTVGIFADVSSLFYCVGKKFPDRKLDYGQLRELVVGSDTIYRAVAYGVQAKDEATKFITCLKKIGFEPKYKQPRSRQGGDGVVRLIKTNWNVSIALDVVNMIDKLDIVAICSSDPELAPIVEYVKARGKKCTIVSCGIPRELRAVADTCIEITPECLEEAKATTVQE